MPILERQNSRKRAYSRISLKKRKLLVRLVLHEGHTISKVIKQLNLKLTTARLIIQKFKQTGTFPMRKFKKQRRINENISKTYHFSNFYNLSSEQHSLTQKQQQQSQQQYEINKVQFSNVQSLSYYPSNLTYYFWPYGMPIHFLYN